MAMIITRDEFLGENAVDELSSEVIESRLNIYLQAEIFMRMKELGLTQKDLASKMGISPAAVSRMLSPESNMRLSTIARIASALECGIAPIRLVPGDSYRNSIDGALREYAESAREISHPDFAEAPTDNSLIASAF